MNSFRGFPARMGFTPLPNLFFSSLLPQIGDINELKITLYILAAVYRKSGYIRFVSYHELLATTSLMRSLKGTSESPDEVLRNILRKATQRGTILHMVSNRDGATEDIYFINTEANQQIIARLQNGELTLEGSKIEPPGEISTEEPTDIFTIYEQNIGMLTPMIAEELADAEKQYPPDWIKDAIKEAVSLNKRNWRYISRILERWSTEGRGDGTYRQDSKKTDPDKYIKGEYGHMVRR
ncbi:MAG: DnaD domain protein [Dehalococcoidales bacterium]|nr:DnaD domain protein [Dehalococcoidales bacterium]